MTKQRRTSALAAAVVSAAAAFALSVGTPAASAQWRSGTSSATPGDAALAARFADLGSDALRAKTIVEPSWRASAALLQAANRLDPGEARYPRLMLDADLQAHDRLAAVDAVKAWLKASPNNVSAQTKLVDLYLAGMESSDAKLAYLREIVGKPPVGEQVRSHAATRAARVLLDRAENDQALKTVAEAIRLNPLNVEAHLMRLQMIAPTATPLERTAALLALLRANPAQPPILGALAQEVANAGLAQASLDWYNLAAAVGARMGQPASPGLVAGFVSELFIAGQLEPAQKIADQVLAANPGAVDVWFLKLTMDRATSAASYDETKRKAGVALSNRLAEVRNAAGQKGATTRPVDSGGGLDLPDLAADLNQVKALQGNDVRNAYVTVLADIGWYQVYFLNQPVAPGVMDFLRQTLPADNWTVARLEGWSALVQGKTDEAKVKLSAVADRDPLSALGMVRLAGKDQKAQDAAHADARKLVNANPSGLVGAMLWGELKGPAVQFVKSSQAEAIEAELNKFPRDLLKILDTPQEFYAIRGEPRQIAHGYGEPLTVDVTIQNISDYDLTVGPAGVIRPNLWFDVRLRGAIDEQFATVDTVAEQGVLKARQGITQTVRLDRERFGQYLSANPAASVQVYTGVMTNPQAVQKSLVPGPAGYRVQFPHAMERQATAIGGAPQRQRLYNLIANGNGDEKIRAIEVLATYVQMFRTNKDIAKQKEAVAVADEMANAVRTGMSDQEPSVQAWATYMSALIGPQDQLPGALRQMMTDKAWQKRLLALTAVPALIPEQRKQLPADLGTDDADPVVRDYAKAEADLRAVAATQPSADPRQATTAPAEAPAANP